MSAKKITLSKRRSIRNFSQDSFGALSQNSEKGKSNRTKNYSAEECSALITCCDKFHVIINLNSSRDKDKNEKALAWKQIKRDFDMYCKSNGIFVSMHLYYQMKSVCCLKSSILIFLANYNKTNFFSGYRTFNSTITVKIQGIKKISSERNFRSQARFGSNWKHKTSFQNC